MSALSYAVTDSTTMLRRNLRHALRYPSMTFATVVGPVLILLLFNYAFGGALGDGIGRAAGGASYIDYLAPGIILLAATSGSIATAGAVCTDMTEGIINRFRTMAISRSSVLTGHVVGSMVQTLASVAFVIAIAIAIGFRPTANLADWLAAFDGVQGENTPLDDRRGAELQRARRPGRRRRPEAATAGRSRNPAPWSTGARSTRRSTASTRSTRTRMASPMRKASFEEGARRV